MPKAGTPGRSRATKERALERRPEVVQAVLECLAPGSRLGPQRVIQQVWPESGKLRYPLLHAAKAHGVVNNALVRCRKPPTPPGGWHGPAVEAAAFPAKRHDARALLTQRELKRIAERCVKLNRWQQPQYRPEIRGMIRGQLMLRQRQLRDKKYTPAPLSRVALEIISGPKQPTQPGNRWFTSTFYPQVKQYGCQEKGSKAQDAARAATYKESALRADMAQVAESLESRGLLTAGGKWAARDTHDIASEGRTPGWASRARVVQTDESGGHIWFDNDGKFQRCKAACGVGDEVLKRALENRESFTFVPWVDLNGEFIFAQLLFKGAGMTGHLAKGALGHAKVLVQFTESAVQTVESFAEAIRQLRVGFDIMHRGDIAGEEIIVTTDGHASRFGDAAFAAMSAHKCTPLIRLAGSSGVTQMLDQVFQWFHQACADAASAFAAAHSDAASSKWGLFKHDKGTVIVIVCLLHGGGRCHWCSPWRFIGAWGGVGFTQLGLDVEKLVASKKVVRDMAGPAAATPPQPGAFTNPRRFRAGSKAYLGAELDHVKRRLAGLQTGPETMVDILERCEAPTATAEQQALAAKYGGDLKRGAEGSRTRVKRAKRWDQATGLIADNAGVNEGRRQQQEEREAARVKKGGGEQRMRELQLKWAQCQLGCVCNPPEPAECVARVYSYCPYCHKDGRQYMKRAKCGRKGCVERRSVDDADDRPPPPPPPTPPTAPEPAARDMPLAQHMAPGPATAASPAAAAAPRRQGGRR